MKTPGKFLILLQQTAFYNPTLAEHLNTPPSKNATYLSPLLQTELIKVIGINAIHIQIIKKIARAKFFSIMEKKVTTHNEEMLSIYFGYVDQNK